MKFGVLNKTTTENRFVLHTLQRNITHLAVITRKTNIKLGILKGGNWKRAVFCLRAFITLFQSSIGYVYMYLVIGRKMHSSSEFLSLHLVSENR